MIRRLANGRSCRETDEAAEKRTKLHRRFTGGRGTSAHRLCADPEEKHSARVVPSLTDGAAVGRGRGRGPARFTGIVGGFSPCYIRGNHADKTDFGSAPGSVYDGWVLVLNTVRGAQDTQPMVYF